MKQETNTMQTKEGLHTQGEWESFIQPSTDGLVTTINVGSKRIATLSFVGIEETEANAKVICQAVNERKALLTEIRQLKGYQAYVAEKIYNGDDEILTFNQWIDAGEPKN